MGSVSWPLTLHSCVFVLMYVVFFTHYFAVLASCLLLGKKNMKARSMTMQESLHFTLVRLLMYIYCMHDICSRFTSWGKEKGKELVYMLCEERKNCK